MDNLIRAWCTAAVLILLPTVHAEAKPTEFDQGVEKSIRLRAGDLSMTLRLSKAQRVRFEKDYVAASSEQYLLKSRLCEAESEAAESLRLPEVPNGRKDLQRVARAILDTDAESGRNFTELVEHLRTYLDEAQVARFALYERAFRRGSQCPPKEASSSERKP